MKTQNEVFSETLAAARQLVGTTGFEVDGANYVINSCNDDGAPPYMGVVLGYFARPRDETQAYALTESYEQKLIGAGWSTEGAGVSHSTVSLTKDGYLLQIGAVWTATRSPVPIGDFELYGPCSQIEGISSQEDLTALTATGGTEITAQLRVLFIWVTSRGGRVRVWLSGGSRLGVPRGV
ncbi:MAG: hypothetical protein FWD74_06285, partial [Actinomycetia bacterium]|nr:hypothetical protein [Actinomycetes bacterium]